MVNDTSSRITAGWIEDAKKPTQREQQTCFSDLEQVAQDEVSLRDAFLTLAHYQDVHLRMAKELLEREVWVVCVLMEESGPIWNQLTSPTLQFLPNWGGSERSHIELGHFSHLAALNAPDEDERTLIAACSPCWARVSRQVERESRGYSGPLACRYEPISLEAAVATLGLERILAQIEAATREAGAAVLAEARCQEERGAQLLRVERMPGCQADPAPEAPRSLSIPLLLSLATRRGVWLAVATCLALLIVPLCFLFNLPVILALMPTMCVLVWRCLIGALP